MIVTKCINGCEKEKSCFRYMSPIGVTSSFMALEPEEGGECEYYWEIPENLIILDEPDDGFAFYA